MDLKRNKTGMVHDDEWHYVTLMLHIVDILTWWDREEFLCCIISGGHRLYISIICTSRFQVIYVCKVLSLNFK